MSPVQQSVCYLGPAGTFSHLATGQVTSFTDPVVTPLLSVAAVVSAVEAGHFDAGVLPVENSVRGENAEAIDALIAAGETISLIEEILVPIRFGAYVSPSWTNERPTKVVSHPNALGQCRAYIASLGATEIEAASTADACERVARLRDPYLVALAHEGAALAHDLRELMPNVGDVGDAVTRFVVVGRELASVTDNMVTTLVLTPPHTASGALVGMLRPFADASINVRELVARPLGRQLGEYCFFVTCSGDVRDPAMRSVLSELAAVGVRTRLLGSYQAAVPSVASNISTTPSRSSRNG